MPRKRATAERLDRLRNHAPDASRAADALEPGLRHFIARSWEARIATEARAVPAFLGLCEDLRALDAPRELLDIAAAAVDEEAQHAEICAYVASVYAGRRIDSIVDEPYAAPQFLAAPEPLRPLLRVLGTCSLMETISSAFIERSRSRSTAPLVRDAYRLLLADEVDHARLGWGALAFAGTRPGTRALIGGCVPALMEVTMRGYARHGSASTLDAAAHGILAWRDADVVVYEALRGLVLPGFEALGVDAQAGRAWLDARAGRSFVFPGVAPAQA